MENKTVKQLGTELTTIEVNIETQLDALLRIEGEIENMLLDVARIRTRHQNVTKSIKKKFKR